MDRVFFDPKKDASQFNQTARPESSTRQYNESYKNGLPMIMPVRLKLSDWGDWWTIPIEPLVSVTGSNVVVKRTVAKAKYRGSIKERWSTLSQWEQKNFTILCITIQSALLIP